MVDIVVNGYVTKIEYILLSLKFVVFGLHVTKIEHILLSLKFVVFGLGQW